MFNDVNTQKWIADGNPKRMRSLVQGLLAFAAVATANAQLTYYSDSRSVSITGGIYTNSYGPSASIDNYSGDYSNAATPSAPFAPFDWQQSTGASLDVNYEGQAHGHFNSSAGVGQTSFLHPQEIYFSSFVAGNQIGNNAWGQECSSLLVSFGVASPVQFTLTCNFGPDPLFSFESYVLGSDTAGTLVSSTVFPNGLHEYTGTFFPGQVYTLQLQESAGVPMGPGDSGFLTADLLIVPEPSSATLIGGGVLVLLFSRHLSKRHHALSAQPCRQAIRTRRTSPARR